MARRRRCSASPPVPFSQTATRAFRDPLDLIRQGAQAIDGEIGYAIGHNHDKQFHDLYPSGGDRLMTRAGTADDHRVRRDVGHNQGIDTDEAVVARRSALLTYASVPRLTDRG